MTRQLKAEFVVLDIEGTTSAAGFILGDLYDYARPRLASWLTEHSDDPDIKEAVAQIGKPTVEETVDVLHGWMAEDVKATPLKTIQGQIWAAGFAAGEIKSHFFADVIPQLRKWATDGVKLAVFSSGSVASQRPWFRHSPDGDLTPLIVDFFDTVSAGPKKESESYNKIARALGTTSERIVFFSDHPDELVAAIQAGWQPVAVARAGEPWEKADFGVLTRISSFADVEVTA
jgi:enolase-phosphatase E1